jgi:hypothetical protein
MAATLFGKNASESSAQHDGSDGLRFRSGQAYPVSQTLTDGATISWDVSLGQNATVTLAGNRTLAAPTNMTTGCFYLIEVRQDATGSRTLAWNAIFKFAAGTAPTLNGTISSRDFFCFESDGTNMYEVGRTQGVI